VTRRPGDALRCVARGLPAPLWRRRPLRPLPPLAGLAGECAGGAARGGEA